MKSILFLSLALLSFNAHAGSTSKKAVLQATMQRHLDEQLVDGAVIDIDLVTGGVRKLYPTKAHPMILMIGDYYILCSDLTDLEGNKSLVDYYIAREDEEFIVFRTEIDNRAPLRKLVKAGVAVQVK